MTYLDDRVSAMHTGAAANNDSEVRVSEDSKRGYDQAMNASTGAAGA
jgi:hypothetical protein